jgi:hypothetical protein
MPTDAQIAANSANAEHSTGPRTEAGKTASSRNGLAHGLFTKGDFVREAEQDDYDCLRAAYWEELNPQTVLEQTYVAAIVSAAWRLRRCSLLELSMAGFFGLDPMEDQVALPIQTSIDRARSQSFNMLRHSTAELRRLQTDRALREQLAPSPEKDLISYKQIVSTLTHAKRGKLLPFPPQNKELGSDCNPTESIARNARCPCGSGEKYKRCCGKDAPPVLGRAA